MTRFLAERGVESRFVSGLRVTTPEVLDAVLKVFAGTINSQFVASLVAAGARAVGLSGIDACLAEAEPMNDELGAVGRLVRCDPELLDTLVNAGFLPVVACVAGDRQGRIFNVNADQMAVACALGFRAERLLFLTDVDGVRNANGEVVSRLGIDEAKRLIAGGVATAGMQAKLTAADQALAEGVAEVIIAPGGAPDVVSQLVSGQRLGTSVLR
jgi:acetylglutamate kinase